MLALSPSILLPKTNPYKSHDNHLIINQYPIISHIYNMKSTLINLLIASAALCLPATAFAQTETEPTASASFNIGNKKYYLHLIKYTRMDDIGVSCDDVLYNQNMTADNQYIYIADHADIANSIDSLTIKRYSAFTGDRVEDLVIGYSELYENDIDLMNNDQRCFYLIPSNDDKYLILFPNIDEENGLKPNNKFYFFLIDKVGGIERKFTANININTFGSFCNSSKNPIGEFGIPEIVGNVELGNFSIYIPMTNWLGDSMIANFTFSESKQISVYSVYTCQNDSCINTKPTLHFVDDNFMIIDDIDILPSLYSYNFSYNTCYDSLDDINILGHGCNWFTYKGHRFLYVGDIGSPNGSTSKGITQFKIALWDEDTTTLATSDYPSINFNTYTPLATLSFGETTAKKARIPYTYRQFMSVTDFGNNVLHLHFYVPGEFLATYQLNESDIPTSVGEVTDIIENQEVGYHISDKTIIFDTPISEVSVFNMVGHTIFHSENPVKSINLANFVKGTYIVSTPYQSFKILL